MIIKSIHQLIAGRTLYAVAPDATVQDACQLLEARDIGALAVVSDERLVGILSERDVVRRCLSRGLAADQTLVGDVMTTDPVTVGCTQTLAESLSLMIEGGFRHLPVVELGGDVVGMISMRDIPSEYHLIVEPYLGDTTDKASA